MNKQEYQEYMEMELKRNQNYLENKIEIFERNSQELIQKWRSGRRYSTDMENIIAQLLRMKEAAIEVEKKQAQIFTIVQMEESIDKEE